MNINSLIAALEQRLSHYHQPPGGYAISGKLQHVGSTLLTALLPGVVMGEICRVLPANILAEVIHIDGLQASLSPFAPTGGLRCGQMLIPLGHRFRVPVGCGLQGRVIDGLCQPLDGGAALAGPWRDFDVSPPCALKRNIIQQPMLTGIRAIDSLITCGEGQRVGIFSAAGTGKSTLMAAIGHSSMADINVFALIGERGREVREFLQEMGEEIRSRSVFVVATSDRPALERLRALFVATTIAESFRDQGKKVLLLADSLTRYARAAREIALAAGESSGAGGYPPSVFSALPRLLERAGKNEFGSITAFYTVLVEGDDINEPLADEVRSLLDGHIILSRRLAESGHFPAIDVLTSLSRVMPMVTSEEHRKLAASLRNLLSVWREVELLVRVGEYKRGEDPVADRAVEAWPRICEFLRQRGTKSCNIEELLQKMRQLTGMQH